MRARGSAIPPDLWRTGWRPIVNRRSCAHGTLYAVRRRAVWGWHFEAPGGAVLLRGTARTRQAAMRAAEAALADFSNKG